MKKMNRSIALAVSAFALAACGAFHSKPAVEVSTKDANVNDRWHASLVSPASLAGAVQITGTASMAPGGNPNMTSITLSLANATPGGVHPWAVHTGQCGDDQGLFGPASSYRALSVGTDGKGASNASVALPSPATGSYFVTVRASAANDETVIACGNFAAPTT